MDAKSTKQKDLGSDWTHSKKLVNVIPNNKWELIIEFDNGEFGLFQLAELGNELTFLSHPQKSKAFNFTTDYIQWLPIIKGDDVAKTEKQIWGVCAKLYSNFIYEKCTIQTLDALMHSSIELGSQNQAPTPMHKSHHVYYVYFYPLNRHSAFNLGESVGGGHAERGGSINYSLDEMIQQEDWKNHFELSNCAWAINIIEENSKSPEDLCRKLIGEYGNRLSL